MVREKTKEPVVRSGAGPQSADLHTPSNSAGKERVHVFSSGFLGTPLIDHFGWKVARAKRAKVGLIELQIYGGAVASSPSRIRPLAHQH